MSSGFTGQVDPLSCEALRALPLRGDICFACFDGVFCNADKSVCQDLSDCAIDGSQTCPFFKSCKEDTSMTISTNDRSQFVTRCQVDGLRVTIFVLGCILTLAFVVVVGFLVRDHTMGRSTRYHVAVTTPTKALEHSAA